MLPRASDARCADFSFDKSVTLTASNGDIAVDLRHHKSTAPQNGVDGDDGGPKRQEGVLHWRLFV